MAKYCNSDILDAAFDEIINNCNMMTVCNAMPTTRAEAAVTFAIGDIAMVVGDFTVGVGDTSGRKLTVGQKDWLEIDASDTGIYIALVDATRLLYVVPCTPVALTIGTFWSVPAWEIEIRDPV